MLNENQTIPFTSSPVKSGYTAPTTPQHKTCGSSDGIAAASSECDIEKEETTLSDEIRNWRQEQLAQVRSSVEYHTVVVDVGRRRTRREISESDLLQWEPSVDDVLTTPQWKAKLYTFREMLEHAAAAVKTTGGNRGRRHQPNVILQRNNPSMRTTSVPRSVIRPNMMRRVARRYTIERMKKLCAVEEQIILRVVYACT